MDSARVPGRSEGAKDTESRSGETDYRNLSREKRAIPPGTVVGPSPTSGERDAGRALNVATTRHPPPVLGHARRWEKGSLEVV